MVYERVQYKLIDNDRGATIWLNNDPKGWDESEKTLKRSEKTYGVWTELSKGLEFFEDGADFLRIARYNRDIEANVTLQEWRTHPEEDSIYLHSQGTFDFSEFEETELGVKVPFKTGGLNTLVKSKFNEKFELGRLLSIKNKDIDPLSTKDVGFTGRNIFLVTSWNTDNENKVVGDLGDTYVYMMQETNSGATRDTSTSIPFRIAGQSHEPWGTNQTSVNASQNQVGTAKGSAGNVFFFNTDQQRTLRLSLAYDFDAYFQQYEKVQWCALRFSLVTYEGGASLTYKAGSRKCLFEIRSSGATTLTPSPLHTEISLFTVGNTNDKFSRAFQGTYDATIDLQTGESLGLEVWLSTDFQSSTIAGIRLYIQDINCTLEIQEDSYFPNTISKTALMHDVGEKLMQIITGEKLKFRSNFYGTIDLGYDEDAEFSLTGLIQGFWVRGFLENEMEMSLKNFIETSNAIHNTGYTVEERNGDEYLVLEDLEYFFQDATTITLTEQVSNLTRKTAKELYYSNLEFGYKKPDGDNLYEEAMGLDEYNTKTSYTTPITRVDDSYQKLSAARADGYGMEFARRKQKETFPKEDSRYDKTVYLLDLKEVSGTESLAQRIWSDDFEQIPIGVYSPETATNLRLTPYRMSQRHEWFYGSGLKKFPQDYITHSNSVGNSYLETKKAGETARMERDSFLVSSLKRSKFVNEWIEFEYEVDYYVNKQIYGYTQINGKSVPNYFGKVKFINEEGLIEYGYLFELKPNKEGKWKLLKAI